MRGGGKLTCSLVPTKNKSLVLCQPIVLSTAFCPPTPLAKSVFCAAAELRYCATRKRTVGMAQRNAFLIARLSKLGHRILLTEDQFLWDIDSWLGSGVQALQ